jgi:hypothetical protein
LLWFRRAQRPAFWRNWRRAQAPWLCGCTPALPSSTARRSPISLRPSRPGGQAPGHRSVTRLDLRDRADPRRLWGCCMDVVGLDAAILDLGLVALGDSNAESPREWRGLVLVLGVSRWLRGQDLNLRPSGYEPDELPGCSTPRHCCPGSEVLIVSGRCCVSFQVWR